ncbi:Sister chromatid cohesion protein 2 [Ascosphaera aggregata]|nr:Sister chromatid cohesion protein 2 [Ascosphaera aggregata]
MYVPQAASNPRGGGPKNLPIADMLLDDGNGKAMMAQQGKPRLVILGLRKPVRVILNRIRGHYIQTKAVDIDMDNKLVEMERIDADGKARNFYMPYDQLVIGVARNGFCKVVSEKIPEQRNVRAFETDTHLRVCGTSNIHAIGDCSMVQNNIAENVVSFVRNLAFKKGKDPETITLPFDEMGEAGTAC